MSKVLFDIIPRAGGENARFYFEPERAVTFDHEFVEAGSTLFFERTEGIATDQRSSFESLTRVRVTDVSGPKPGENSGAVWACMDVEQQVNQRHRFSGYNDTSRNWSNPLWAKSATLGVVQVSPLTGKRYSKDGKLESATSTMHMDFSTIQEYRIVPPAVAVKLRLASR